MEGTMSPFTSVRRTLLSSTVIAALGIASVACTSPASAQGKIPDLASSTFAWLSAGADWRDPPAGMRGPIRTDPDYAYHGNLDGPGQVTVRLDRKSTRLNSSHVKISYAVFCLKKKK